MRCRRLLLRRYGLWVAQTHEECGVDSTERVNLRCSAVVFRGSQVLLLRRERGGSAEWVLPGGTPRRGESAASCARREVSEETGLQVTVSRVAFVLEASNRDDGLHLMDLVFTTTEQDRTAVPQEMEVGLTPVFYPVGRASPVAVAAADRRASSQLARPRRAR